MSYMHPGETIWAGESHLSSVKEPPVATFMVTGGAGMIGSNLVKRLAGAILIEGDLSEGDAVVIEGVQSVRAGVLLKQLNADEFDAMTNG